MLNLVKALSAKYKAATKGLGLSKIAFNDMNEGIPSEMREDWMNLEQIALESRGEHLKIYDIQLEKGKFYIPQNWR